MRCFLEFVGSPPLPFGCGLRAAKCFRYYVFRITSCAFLFGTAHAEQAARIGFAEFIGQAQDFKQSAPIKTPWDTKDKGGYGKKLRGYDRRVGFTFKIKADQNADIHTLTVKEEDRQPFQVKSGQTYTIFNRPVTTWSGFQCSFSITDLEVDWKSNPVIRVIVAAEANYSDLRPDKKEHPDDLIAYLIQVQPQGEDADLPPEHWPVWYINNWIHFARTVMPTVHQRYMANHGFIFWSWGVFDPPTNLKRTPSVGAYRIVTHPETKAVTSIVLHTPGACELVDATDESLRYSRPPAVEIKARKLTGKAPFKISFKASAQDPDGHKILWYSWDFDASNGLQADATDKRTKHTFTKPGKFIISLTAMDETGVPGVAHVRVVIRP